VSIFQRFWSRLRGNEPDPTIGTQLGLVAGAVAVNEVVHGSETPDYGWSGDHMSGGSDFGGSGGGFDGGGGDAGGGGF
jgi:uncharacterized membrane protein YgcG